MQTIMRIAATAALSAWLAGCTTLQDLAHGKVQDPETIPNGDSRLLIVDVREDGVLVDVDAAGEVICPVDTDPSPACTGRLDRVHRWLSSESTEAPIVVFVHGWHHNASDEDENLKGFKRFLGDLEKSRRAAGVKVPAVDGIYVGWRGDEWEFVGPEWIQFLDFPTIWSRKNASVRVGEGGLHTLISALRGVSEQRVLIVAGHSLGGSAVFHAVKDDLDETVASAHEFILMNPAVSTSEFEEVATRVRAQVASLSTGSRV